MIFQGGPVDGREFEHEPRCPTVKVPVLRPMSIMAADEQWRPAYHTRRPYAEHRLREDFFDCHNELCREFAHYCWTAVYLYTPPDSLVFVHEDEPYLRLNAK